MNAVATLLFSPDYLPGTLVLGHALRSIVNPNTKLVVLIDLSAFNQLHVQLLRQLWDEIRDTKVHVSQLHQKLVQDLHRPELASTFTKIQLWNLPYDKVLYLDADTLPLIGDGTNVTDLLQLDFPAGKIVAAPDSGFPDVFNSGVFALRPNQNDYLNLLSLVMSNNKHISFDGADQGLLNQYFNSDPDWVSQILAERDINAKAQVLQASNWIKIPFLYNTTPNTQYQYAPAFNYFQGQKSGSYNHQIRRITSSGSADLNSGDSNASRDAAALASAAYHSTAFNHFSSLFPGNQVKLIHFIGPIKPWKAESSGLFASWWNEWYQYSGGKLLYDTLYGQFFTINVTLLNIPGQKTEKVVHIKDHTARNTTQVRPVFVSSESLIQPSDLHEPINHRRIATEAVSSHTVWNATKKQPLELSNFDADIRAFNSAWNERKPLEEKPLAEGDNQRFNCTEPLRSEEVYESTEPTESIKSANIEPETSDSSSSGGLSHHREQKTEGCIDNSLGYLPKHFLIKKRKEDQSTAIKKKLEALVADLEIDEEEDAFMKAEIEKETPEEMCLVDKINGVPKLFPWEFREEIAPTRTWN